jgi:hypothetical protein
MSVTATCRVQSPQNIIINVTADFEIHPTQTTHHLSKSIASKLIRAVQSGSHFNPWYSIGIYFSLRPAPLTGVTAHKKSFSSSNQSQPFLPQNITINISED